MQIDVGERKAWIAGKRVTAHFMAAVLGYSRRLFVKAFPHERQGEWLDGIASTSRHFGGVPLEVLGDDARAPHRRSEVRWRRQLRCRRGPV